MVEDHSAEGTEDAEHYQELEVDEVQCVVFVAPIVERRTSGFEGQVSSSDLSLRSPSFLLSGIVPPTLDMIYLASIISVKQQVPRASLESRLLRTEKRRRA